MPMRVYVKSFGCSSSIADGQVIAGCLARAGHEIVGEISESQLVIINTCAVKGPTEDRMIRTLKEVPRTKRLIVAGCLPAINGERLGREVCFDGMVGPAAGEAIVKVVRRVAQGQRFVSSMKSQGTLPNLALPRLRSNSVTSIIPISYGCLGSCAYCCVKQARGSLRSYSIEEILNRAQKDIESGFKEFWLTSQDVGSYGKDIHADLAVLMRALCGLEATFKIRVGMMTPDGAASILDGLLDAFQNEHIFKFIHLPVQSGDSEVLRRMNRLYSSEDFRKMIQAFRARIPDITLSTDVICGFPGETEEAFERTLSLIEEVRPDIVNVSKFFARPGTPAAEMNRERVPSSEIKVRSERAAHLAGKMSLAGNARWLGWIGQILVDELGKVAGSWIGRNLAYKPIVIQSESDLMGKALKVKIADVFPTYLRAEIID
jgi:threonylcarbamoyladenosine tRNA methylthiotransferase CDKAL1